MYKKHLTERESLADQLASSAASADPAYLVARAFRAAADRLESGAYGWTRDVMARDGDGEPCAPDSPDATQWCALGAATRALCDMGATRDEVDELGDLLHGCTVVVDGGEDVVSLHVFNDMGATVETIVRVMRGYAHQLDGLVAA